MKRLFILLLVLVLPIMVSADTFDLNVSKDFKIQDLTIKFDTDEWYVFTRDNIKDNKELEDLDIEVSYMENFFNTNYMYLDAFQKNEFNIENAIEVFVGMKDVDLEYNLHKYSDKEIKELEEESAKLVKNPETRIMKTDNYVYVVMKYYDNNLNVIDYYTIINGKGYTIKVQKTNNYNSSEISEVDEFIKTIKFDLDSKYEKKPKKSSGFNYIYICPIIGGVTAVFAAIASRKKKEEVK